MKPKNLAEYANDMQEKEQLKKMGNKSYAPMNKSVEPKAPSFKTTGGMSPVALNKRKGKTY